MASSRSDAGTRNAMGKEATATRNTVFKSTFFVFLDLRLI
jgi:hypothetical protein